MKSSTAGNLEKRYLINFRQVCVIALQSRRAVFELVVAEGVSVTGLDFYAKRAYYKGTVISRCFPINMPALTTSAQSNTNWHRLFDAKRTVY